MNLEKLELAINRAGQCRQELMDSGASDNALEFLVVLPLIQEASELQTKLESLLTALGD